MASAPSSAATNNHSSQPPTAKTGAVPETNTKPSDTGVDSSPKPVSPPETDEDAITQAVQVLSNLATLKLKVQESREQALQIRSQIDVLFSDETVSEEVINQIKDGFKVLKTFAQTNLRYREARVHAEQARATLDRALQSGQI
ncbi:MAG: hypothetical protein SFW36_02860 [Leptolyngbyaceae cyanobacterium bins.59]|nr:hypothetical protein [Leptolyngbyaceae cyanobacterium bins.59]